MEFYIEKKHVSRKNRVCECCGGGIAIGDVYWRETGKYEGYFFSRALHDICHGMEILYCNDIDTEFSWDDVNDHARETVCYDCEHGFYHEDDEGFVECPYINEKTCPRWVEKFSSAKEIQS